ncbi:MAG: TetR/AcrR family transcriptional regulator [Mycobacteriales bacterium]
MRARAEAAEQTRHRILRATLDLATETLTLAPVLTAVAERAGVSVQTVLRHFGSSSGLLDAVEVFARAQVAEERAAPAGDVTAAIAVLIEHYERRGEWALVMLGQERKDARARRATQDGRRLHREWVQAVFGPQLAARQDAARLPLTDLLVVATDVYAWKLLRHDRQLSREQVESRLTALVTAVLRMEEF